MRRARRTWPGLVIAPLLAAAAGRAASPGSSRDSPPAGCGRAATAAGHDRGFVFSGHADWPALLRTAHETGARRVIATHGDTDALVRVLNERGIDTGVFATDYGEDD